MRPAIKEILTNREIIAVNQDWGGKQGFKLRDDGDTEVWMKPMSDGSRAVVLLNRGGADGPVSIVVTPKDLGLKTAKKYSARNLWTHANQTVGKELRVSVASHNAAVFIIRPN